jgi:hypothetical protein
VIAVFLYIGKTLSLQPLNLAFTAKLDVRQYPIPGNQAEFIELRNGATEGSNRPQGVGADHAQSRRMGTALRAHQFPAQPLRPLPLGKPAQVTTRLQASAMHLSPPIAHALLSGTPECTGHFLQRMQGAAQRANIARWSLRPQGNATESPASTYPELSRASLRGFYELIFTFAHGLAESAGRRLPGIARSFSSPHAPGAEFSKRTISRLGFRQYLAHASISSKKNPRGCP